MKTTEFSNRDDIKQYRTIINLIPQTIKSIRTQNSCLKRDLLDTLLQKFGETAEYLPNNLQEQFGSIINQLFEPIQAHDDILTADYLENMIKPFFIGILESEVSQADPAIQAYQINENLSVELTTSGIYTMKYQGIYFHSNISPEDEAQQLAEYWDDPKEKVSLVLGLGLGYHVLKMLELDPYRKVYVFEPVEDIIKACKKYGVYDHIIESGHAEIIYDATLGECANYAKKYLESKLNIYYPTFATMPEGAIKDSFRKYYTVYSSTKHQKRSYYMSFRENTSLEYHGLPELKFRNEAKRAIIVSAGPSLDKNFLELKKAGKDTVIIATAPTMRKLYKADITPDCVVISDTKPSGKKFHEGAENVDWPLVFSSTASVPFVADHKGPRYILCPEGFEPAENLAKENSWPIIKSFGSVALTALALVINKGFKEIVFIGQDLCYKGRTLHAEGTSAQFTKFETSIANAKDILGDDVTIPNDFALFKSQIETTIKEHPEIKFLNATEGGVHIEGARDVKLKDVI